jgi:hypothetical protein
VIKKVVGGDVEIETVSFLSNLRIENRTDGIGRVTARTPEVSEVVGP